MALVGVNWRPGDHQLRGFGTASVVVFGALAAWALWRHSIFGVSLGPERAWRIAAVLWGLAAMCGVLRIFAPRWLRPLYIGLVAVSLPVGLAISHGVVGIVFFGIVTPIALAFRLIGRDALERTFDRAAATYWAPRTRIADVARYYRQF
jgi:hypothetical protein